MLLQSNLIGPGSLWEQGDAVTKLVALLLLAMSLASWYVIVTKAYRLWRLNQAARQVQHGFWTANSVAQGTRALGEVGQGRRMRRAAVMREFQNARFGFCWSWRVRARCE